ncbi:hypothetical protein C8J56DRAFT_103264 [Mycena floridula]|nr:hypothetical protein C8J56DRAFT_103264 [Mycena floridula]
MAPCTGNCKNCCSIQSPPFFRSLDPLRHDEVLSLLRNNASSIGSISESSVISLAAKDLTDCSSQIRLYERERNRIDGILMSLKNEKRCLERHWKDCQGLRAPIRRLPAEVLRNVFILLEGKSKMAGPETNIEGFRVAAVSHHWRNVALSTQQLWTTITVDEGSSSNPAKQLRVLDRVLKLSGSQPLSLTVNTSDVDIKLLASRLCAESHRWVHAVFNSNHPSELWKRPTTTSLPSLEHLVVFVTTILLTASHWHRHHSTPKLHTLELGGISAARWHHLQSLFPRQHIHIGQNVLIWTNVRQLILTEIPLDLILDLISQCPSLTSTTIKKCELLSLAVPPASSNYKSSLTTLSLVDCPKIVIDGIFQQIDFPQLTSLTIEGSPNDSVDDSSFPVVAFAWMLYRTKAKLQSLTFDDLTISSSDQLFELVPSLTSLTIKSTSGLISDSILNRMNTNREFPARILLPNLDKLTLRLISGFTSRTFVEMIQSRWFVTTMARHVAELKKAILDVEFQLEDQDLRPLKVLKAAGMDIVVSDSRGLVSLDTGDEE